MQNTTYIITGASSGIGAAAATFFAQKGANVVLGARREDHLKQVCDRIKEAGGNATYMAGDVASESYANALVEHARQHFGALHGAFNNAGTVGDLSPLETMNTQNWLDVLNTNLNSAFYAAKAQIPALKETGGALLFTGSFVGYSNGGMPGMGAYAASKAGLLGLVKSLAADLGADNIRVNALLPGGTKTAMAGDDPATHEQIAELHALKRMASAEEIAKTAAFLLSQDASFITGASILADGGVSARLI